MVEGKNQDYLNCLSAKMDKARIQCTRMYSIVRSVWGSNKNHGQNISTTLNMMYTEGKIMPIRAQSTE